ncbi:MAG: hypothetical protein KZQ77_15315 [Candidatus Thiodiazotropha sp. (ex Notomyrtea botanica)]|nr:hypothetical protein [Candidatus Thiodiazotropha sp. (ex Notomyrtea botanica)]
MAISFPTLAVGWVLLGAGTYYLGSSIFGYPTNEENTSLAAIWSFALSFGVISISSLFAAKAKFAARAYVQQIYKYSIISSAAMFLGYAVLGVLPNFFIQ